jgi:hypothetical protein
MGIEVYGRTGRLRSGCRPVAALGPWHGTDLPGRRRMRVAVSESRRDPVRWGQHTAPLVVDLDVGSQVWRGTATIESEEPLVLIVEEFDLV